MSSSLVKGITLESEGCKFKLFPVAPNDPTRINRLEVTFRSKIEKHKN